MVSLAESLKKKNNDGVYEPDTNLILTSKEAQENYDNYKSVEMSSTVLEHGEILSSSETELLTSINKSVKTTTK